MRCQSVLKNTSISRMRNHRRKCGSLKASLIESKTENENDEHEETMTIAPTEVTNTIVWTPEHFEDVEPVNQTIEKVNQTTYEIITSDIQRHSDIQRQKKSSSSKRRRSSIDSSSIDVSLSRFLIGCNLPFDTVDSHHFKQFINKINKNYVIPSSSDLKLTVLSQLEKSTSPKSSKKRKNYETTESDSDDE